MKRAVIFLAALLVAGCGPEPPTGSGGSAGSGTSSTVGTGGTGGAICAADITSDPLNCGACGHVCSFPHAATACFGGACAMLACNEGWASCNDVPPDNGCETDITSDTNNCGGCGRVCLTGQTCKDGVCLDPGCVSACCPGCIDGNADCVQGNTHMACGHNGGACVTCATNETCDVQSGTCSPPH